MIAPTLQQLDAYLIEAGLADEQADVYARYIFDDVTRFDLAEFRLLVPYRTPKGPVVEYEFGKTAYSIENAWPSDAPDFKKTGYGGSQLNRENILYLGRVSEVAREVVPTLWLQPDRELLGKISSPRQHLNTLSEFWWLSRWKGGAGVSPNRKINPNCELDIDWQLSWTLGLGPPVTVNLEVKRRLCDLGRTTYREPISVSELFESGLEDETGNRKFRPSTNSEINVVALTLMGEIDHDVQFQAGQWIKEQSDIDALLLFTRFSDRKSGFDFHVIRKRQLLDQFLNTQLAPIDTLLHARVETPLPFAISQLQFLP